MNSNSCCDILTDSLWESRLGRHDFWGSACVAHLSSQVDFYLPPTDTLVLHLQGKEISREMPSLPERPSAISWGDTLSSQLLGLLVFGLFS